MSKTAYIKRTHLENQLARAIEAAAAKPNYSGINQDYQNGKAEGFSEGLNAARQLLVDLQDTPKPIRQRQYYESPDVPTTYAADFLLRDDLQERIRYAIEDAAKKPIPTGDNTGYECGKAFGFSDGLKAAQVLLHELEDEPKPERRFVYGRSLRGE